METSDPIADLLTQIRNSLKARHRYIDIQHSKIKEAIVKILKDKGLIAYFLVKEEKKKKSMRVFLKYTEDRDSVIRGIKRISKPSCRKYVSSHEIPRVFGGLGIAILSTSQGVIDGSAAKERKIGGELLCLAW